MEIFLQSNIKLLRKRGKVTQDDLAKAVGTNRSSINNYENGITPPLEILLALADYFKMSADTLVRTNLEKLSEFLLSELDRGNDVFVRGTKLRVLATTTDSQNKENIEVVNHKAMAGYTAGYNDPEYLQGLPTFQMPFLARDRKYRMFQISGDSMLPIPDRSYVIGEYLQNWNEIKDGSAYIILTREDGIIFKVAFNEIRKRKHLLLKSLNRKYNPFELPVENITEVWKFVNYISAEIPGEIPLMEEVQKKMEELKGLLGG